MRLHIREMTGSCGFTRQGPSAIIGRGLSGRRRIRSFLRGVRDYGRLRHVHRMRESGAGEATEVLIYGSQSFLGERLQAACRDRGVTVNDIFLAALCAALAEMTPLRLKHGRRRGIALASAVDMRVSARTDLQDNFGVYLGQALVVVNDPELYDFVQLLACISAQMSAEKKAAAFTVTDWNLLSIVLLKGRFLLKNKRAWYRKVWPLSAGLSNVKVDRSWFLSSGEHILDYVRIAPTGPALPLVLTPTTLDGSLNLSLVYRRSCLNSEQGHRLITIFVSKLKDFLGV
jgi:NRPS condensation-like uncharacterized protein